MIASKIQNSKSGCGRLLNFYFYFGIIGVIVASKIQNSKIGRNSCRVQNLAFWYERSDGSQNLNFADWPFPESARAKLQNPEDDFVGWALI